jgi:hypothetical protein
MMSCGEYRLDLQSAGIDCLAAKVAGLICQDPKNTWFWESIGISTAQLSRRSARTKECEKVPVFGVTPRLLRFA